MMNKKYYAMESDEKNPRILNERENTPHCEKVRPITTV
jgi:hypothetical protein